MNQKFDMKAFKEILNLREKFAQNRFNEKVSLSDHQFGNSSKLVGVKHTSREEILDKQDEINEKQHKRKLKQIEAIRKR